MSLFSFINGCQGVAQVIETGFLEEFEKNIQDLNPDY
jgi:hypothetical protein